MLLLWRSKVQASTSQDISVSNEDAQPSIFRILHNPTPHCAWLISDRVLFGAHPSSNTIQSLVDAGVTTVVSLVTDEEIKKYNLYQSEGPIKILRMPIPDGGITSDDDTFALAHRLAVLLETTDEVIYIHCRSGHGRTGIVAACLVSEVMRYDPPRAIKYVQLCHKSRKENNHIPCPTLQGKQYAQINRFRRPLRAIFCGDRDSSYTFEEQLTLELRDLPPHSVVIHGDCKGIDRYAAELAELMKIKTIPYPVSQEEWRVFGLGAGPMRNKMMLDVEKPDVVFAFHPDINLSKGTRDMVLQAWQSKVPVFVHDTKRKLEFRGNFDDM